MVWRLYHPSGATVDYWSESRAQQAQKAVAGSYYEKVDARTGMKVSA